MIYIYVYIRMLKKNIIPLSHPRIGSLAERLRQDKSETASKVPHGISRIWSLMCIYHDIYHDYPWNMGIEGAEMEIFHMQR